jgi:hypothetical protein
MRAEVKQESGALARRRKDLKSLSEQLRVQMQSEGVVSISVDSVTVRFNSVLTVEE